MFVKAAPAAPARTDASQKIAVLYAAILAAFTVAQLFTFEDFIELLPSFGLPLHDVVVAALPATLIACQLFAIPFLLRMWLSPAFRWISMLAGWLAALLWVVISVWVVSTGGNGAETVGFLGTAVDLVPGWWSVLVAISLAIVAAWSSWGLWPNRSSKKVVEK